MGAEVKVIRARVDRPELEESSREEAAGPAVGDRTLGRGGGETAEA